MNKTFRSILSATIGALLVSPAIAVTTPGVVTLTGTISDYAGGSNNSTSHYSVAWVADSTGAFIKTLWKQGPDYTSKEWGDHMPTYNNARAGSTVVDGFTGATSTSYSAPVNNPITTTWNCRDASGNLVPDGDYYFYIQYTESQTVSGVIIEGPLSSGLLFTKGSSASTVNLPPQGTQGTPTNGNNFTDMSIVWTPATVPPTITSAIPPAAGSMGTAYSHTFTATGSPQIRFVLSSGSLPTGVTLASTGELTGIPTVAGTFNATISADNGLAPANQPISITIAEAIVFTNTIPTNGNRRNKFQHTSTVIGTKPVVFSLHSGALPPGVTLGTNGVFSGTPTTLGTFTGKIRAQNRLAPTALQDFSIIISPATEGYVDMTATISDYTGTTSTTSPTEHYSAVWVTDAAGKFIKTIWKQGPGFSSKEWNDHLPTYNNARAGSTALDGFTSATAWDYTSSPNNPLMVTWNCRDAKGNLVDDGDYKFWIQYSENQRNVQGPVTTGGLTWTKGPSPSTVFPPDQSTQGSPTNVSNFTNMWISWTLAPDIALHDPGHAEMFNGGFMDMGSVVLDTMGAAQTFTIRNDGSDDLNISKVSIYGTDGASFMITQPTANTLAPAASATFTVTFKPCELGFRTAVLQIASDDIDEGLFEVELAGTGTPPPAPEIAVIQTSDSGLVSGVSKRSFGTVKVGSSSAVKRFTIKNGGTAPLENLRITKSRNSLNEFVLNEVSYKPIMPGMTATFTVTFKPKRTGPRSETIYIMSNDADENPFSIKLMGAGVK